jgi:predicted dehydrogenase
LQEELNMSRTSQKNETDRRTFFKQTLSAGILAPAFIKDLISSPPSDLVRVASCGAAGMAYSTLDGICTHPKAKLIAVAEVDSSRLERVKRRYSEARVYSDWRRMLDRERRNVDAVCVGTPDHMHAPMAMLAMNAGLHVYVQKPLTHNIFEARRLARTARRKRLVSQMGIQCHSMAEYKTAVKVIQDGAIGKVREVHAWSNKKWGDPDPLPDRSDPIPPSLDWNQWIGVAEMRPYLEGYYHPGNWRKRIDFGTATFGDMGCHIYDPVFAALQLTAPRTVRSDGPAPNKHNWPINCSIQYVFPGTPFTEGDSVPVTWYDGDRLPPDSITALIHPVKVPGQGSIFIGTKGIMLLGHIAMPVLLPQDQFREYGMPKIDTDNHYHQFVDAVLGNGKASAAFDYSGPLTEAVLLGPLATWFPGETLQWNAPAMKFVNSKEATAHVRRSYRKGWKIKGL